MSVQNLIIYKFNELYQILEELGLDLNFKIIVVDNEESLNDKIKKIHNYLIISNIKYSDINNQFVLDYAPINIFKLIEKINIEFLKLQFNSQSEVIVKNYTIDLNSREMLKNNIKLKLTEKEINTITYLSKSEKQLVLTSCKKKFGVISLI